MLRKNLPHPRNTHPELFAVFQTYQQGKQKLLDDLYAEAFAETGTTSVRELQSFFPERAVQIDFDYYAKTFDYRNRRVSPMLVEYERLVSEWEDQMYDC